MKKNNKPILKKMNFPQSTKYEKIITNANNICDNVSDKLANDYYIVIRIYK